MCKLYSIWCVRLSYKLMVFSWLVMYKGIPSKAQLAKSGLSNSFCPIYHSSKSVKHIFRVSVCQMMLEIPIGSVLSSTLRQGSLACYIIWRLSFSLSYYLFWDMAILRDFSFIQISFYGRLGVNVFLITRLSHCLFLYHVAR